jgi:hypothetical protein
MMTEMDIETSVYNVHLTRLIAREDFIKFTRRESTKTYTIKINQNQNVNTVPKTKLAQCLVLTFLLHQT